MLTDRKLQGLVIQKELNESLLDLVNVVMGFQVLRLLYNLYTVIYSNKNSNNISAMYERFSISKE